MTKMNQREFFQLLHRRLAQVSVGSSSLRNQGAPGVLETCREYFEKGITLDSLIDAIPSKTKFPLFLNAHTDTLRASFKQKARHFGTARKALNLFFRDVVYNKFISAYYSIPNNTSGFKKFAEYLEVPLDKYVALGITSASDEPLPKWRGIIHLSADDSRKFQDAAMTIASKMGIPRIHLDLKYYRPAG